MLFENRQIFIRVEQGKIESDQWIEWSWGDFQQNSGNIKKIMLLNFWKKKRTYLPCLEGCLLWVPALWSLPTPCLWIPECLSLQSICSFVSLPSSCHALPLWIAFHMWGALSLLPQGWSPRQKHCLRHKYQDKISQRLVHLEPQHLLWPWI